VSPWAMEEGTCLNVGAFAAQFETPQANPRHGICGLRGFSSVQTPTPIVHHQGRMPLSTEERSSPMAQRRGPPKKRRARSRWMVPSQSRSITPAPNEGKHGWENPFSRASHKVGKKRIFEGPPSCQAGREHFLLINVKKRAFLLSKWCFLKQS
jgi:hypothetical protein